MPVLTEVRIRRGGAQARLYIESGSAEIEIRAEGQAENEFGRVGGHSDLRSIYREILRHARWLGLRTLTCEAFDADLNRAYRRILPKLGWSGAWEYTLTLEY